MDFDFLVPLIFMFIVISMIMGLLALLGLTPGNIGMLLSLTQRRKTEVQPRDHYDRWDAAQRRAAIINKPSALKWLAVRGDKYVPHRVLGRVRGATPWTSYYVVYIKTRRFAWSDPFVIPQDFASDLNRRTLWVDARGFTKVGPIYYPVPNAKVTNLTAYVKDCLESFRFLFEQQMFSDILENMAWGIDHAMDSPIKDRVRIAEADNPGYVEKDYIPEDQATGGGFA